MENKSQQKVVVHWFRRDLRLYDNHALAQALRSGLPVLPVFIFDKAILEVLEKTDARVSFLAEQVQMLKRQLEKRGSSLWVRFGSVEAAFVQLQNEFSIESVFANEDYEPAAVDRDIRVKKQLSQKGVRFQLFADQLVFSPGTILKTDGKPYTVFTPFSKKWKERLRHVGLPTFDTQHRGHRFFQTEPFQPVSLHSIGFTKSSIAVPPPNISGALLAAYGSDRDFPAKEGTSRLGAHLRFGTVSIREVVASAQQFSDVFLNELIWREFYMAILFHFPHVEKKPFKKEYDAVEWQNNELDFDRWCNGQTGYPLVDAGMRQLMQTGYMHNRVRMVTASFLCKHLLIDWRWGEAWFAQHLLDFELASNNGGWQWAAGTGCDAAPYFRVFNPTLQAKRFDPESEYIRKWVPEHGTPAYPAPVVDHSFARERAIRVYKKSLSEYKRGLFS